MKDRIKPNESGDHYSVFFYLKDITRECNLVRKYENDRVDIATVNIDNFDEFIEKIVVFGRKLNVSGEGRNEWNRDRDRWIKCWQ